MPSRPAVLVFDVNETLSDMAPLAARFLDVGATAAAADLWFAMVLRDAFALTAAGGHATFAEIGRSALRTVLRGATLDRSMAAAGDHILAGLAALPLHPDVAPGLRRLHDAGFTLVTLTNGSVATTTALLERAGLTGLFTHLLSVDDAGVWKPGRAAYAYAATVCGVTPAEMLLTAVHPWDTDGAASAGLATAWVNRAGATYPDYARPPTYVVSGIDELATLMADAFGAA